VLRDEALPLPSGLVHRMDPYLPSRIHPGPAAELSDRDAEANAGVRSEFVDLVGDQAVGRREGALKRDEGSWVSRQNLSLSEMNKRELEIMHHGEVGQGEGLVQAKQRKEANRVSLREKSNSKSSSSSGKYSPHSSVLSSLCSTRSDLNVLSFAATGGVGPK
jgi:hypothetical protein